MHLKTALSRLTQIHSEFPIQMDSRVSSPCTSPIEYKRKATREKKKKVFLVKNNNGSQIAITVEHQMIPPDSETEFQNSNTHLFETMEFKSTNNNQHTKKIFFKNNTYIYRTTNWLNLLIFRKFRVSPNRNPRNTKTNHTEVTEIRIQCHQTKIHSQDTQTKP